MSNNFSSEIEAASEVVCESRDQVVGASEVVFTIRDQVAEQFARFEGDIEVREMLRGRRVAQYTIVMASLIPGLRERFDGAMKIRERWERRRALRSLSSEIARVSVQIYATKDIDPNEFAEERGVVYFLREEKAHLYTSARGLDLTEVKGGDATFCF